MATPDPFADLPAQAAADPFADIPAAPPDPFADLPAVKTAADPFSDLPAMADGKPPLSRYEQLVQAIPGAAGARKVAQGLGGLVTTIAQVPGTLAEVWHEKATGEKADAPLKHLMMDVEEKYLTPPPSDHWTGDIPYYAGQGLGFLATGAIGGPLAIAGAGVGVGGVGQYNEAVAMGADPDEAAVSLAAGSALGATEAIPGAYFLNRLNKFTGGRLAQTIREQGFKGYTKPLVEAIKSFFIEGTQEGAQTAGSNWIASDLAGYDPSRSISENFWDSVLTGGTVGSMFGGGIGLLRRMDEKATMKELEAIYNQQIEDPINAIQGAFTPVEPLMRLYQARQQMDAYMAPRMTAATAEKEELTGGKPIGSPAGALAAARTQVLPSTNLGVEHGPKDIGTPWQERSNPWSMFGVQPVEEQIEKALPRGPDNKPLTTVEAMKHSPVVVSKSNLYSASLQAVENRIFNAREELENPNLSPGLRAGTEKLLASLGSTRDALLAKNQLAIKILREVKSYVANLRSTLGHKTPIAIIDMSSLNPLQQAEMQDTAGYISHAIDVPGVGRGDMMFVSLEELVDESYNSKAVGVNSRFESAKRNVFETISHEFGHSIFTRSFDDLLEKARTGTPEEAQKAYETFNFIEQEYRQWLKDVSAKGTYGAALTTKKPAEDALRRKQTFGTKLSELSPRRRAYIGSMDEFFADMTARLASQGQLPNSTLTTYFKPLMDQYRDMFESFPEFAKNQYGNNWLTWLRSMTLDQKIVEAREAAAAGGGKGIFDALKGIIPGMDPKRFAGLRDHLDRWSRIIQSGFNLLQMEKENSHIPHWSFYRKGVEAWQNYQRHMALRALGVEKAWRGLGKAEASQLSNVFLEEQDLKRRLTPKELSTQLTGEGIQVYTQVRQMFDYILDEMHAFAIEDANKTYEQGSEIQKTEIDRINKEFEQMKARGYFPAIRFGKYTITARATQPLTYQGQEFKPGQLITFPVFESQAERDEAAAVLRQELKGKATISPSIMRENEFAIQGMPRTMLRALKSKMQLAGDLTPDTAEAFDAALQDVAPFRNFRKQFLRKKGIHGASEDMLRSFAYYARSAAGHIARVKYNDELLAAIKGMQDDVEVIKRYGGYAQNRQEMVHWLKRHFDYIMNPANELAALRGAGFVAYLGFNIKSAMVNALQIPMVSYPYLAARYGDIKAGKELTKSTNFVRDWVQNRKAYVDALPDEQGNIKSPDDERGRLGQMIATGLNEGWLDQSLATELAIAASENNLDRGLHLPTGKRVWHNVSRYSAMPFHLVEKMNRYITASAAYRLEYDKSGDHGKSILAAKQAVWTTQYENSRWNRPEILRGKKSAALLFMNYVQNTLHFAIKDKGARRWWMMMLLMGGLMGLPGAEDLEDLVDFTVTALNRQLGLKNPKFQLRVELREALEDLHANPDLILHGLSQDTFGLGQVGELTGIPIPHFDLSGSVGMGNIIPGTGIPGMIQQGDANSAAVQGAAEIGGATGNLVEQFYSGLFSKDPDSWKRMEKLLPLMSVRNISKAIRYASRGQETTAAGDVVAKFDPHDMRDQLEMVGQGLGFTPSKVTQGWERVIAVKDAIQYYKVQQSALQRQINWAFFQEDRESIADVREAIREYNASVPFPELKMTPDSIRTGIKDYVKAHILTGMGEAGERKYRRLQKSIEESYPDPYGDSVRKDPFVEP